MPRLFDSSHYVVSELLAEARWEARDAVSRHSKDKAVDFLLARAAELALSAKGCDQLKGSAISEAVRDIGMGHMPLPDPPAIFLNYDDENNSRRSAVRNEVSKAAAVHWRIAASVASECANSMVVFNDRVASVAQISVFLSPGILTLQKCLWDHPSIAANTETRLKMLFLVPAMQVRLSLPSRKDAAPASRRWPFSHFTARSTR